MTIAEKFVKIAENEQKVFNAGKQAEHDIFWDAFQQNGARTDYNSAFQGAYWNDSNFKPKYDITPAGNAANLFSQSGITDVKGICEAQGINFDFSQVDYCSNFITNSQVTRLPIIDARKISNCSSLFESAKNLVWVDGVILNDEGNQNFGTSNSYNWTLYSGNLEHLPILGGIINTDCFFNACKKLDKVTITSIVNACSVSVPMTLTLSKDAVDKAFEIYEGENNGSTVSMDWLNLIDSRENVNIALV